MLYLLHGHISSTKNNSSLTYVSFPPSHSDHCNWNCPSFQCEWLVLMHSISQSHFLCKVRMYHTECKSLLSPLHLAILLYPKVSLIWKMLSHNKNKLDYWREEMAKYCSQHNPHLSKEWNHYYDSPSKPKVRLLTTGSWNMNILEECTSADGRHLQTDT